MKLLFANFLVIRLVIKQIAVKRFSLTIKHMSINIVEGDC